MRGREFGDAIRALLRAANLTNREAAELLGWDEAKVSELINGKEGTSAIDLAQLLGLLRTPRAEFLHLMALHQETTIADWLQPTGSERPNWMRTLFENEKKASKIIAWSMNLVHGLLQVGSYTDQVCRTQPNARTEDVPAIVRKRLARQKEILDGRRTVTVYLHENALRLPGGGFEVMREQLHHLLQVSVWRFLTIRVVPRSAGLHAGILGAFDLLKFEKFPPIVYLECDGANVYLENQQSIARYEAVLKSLDESALDEKASRRLISEIIEQEFGGAFGWQRSG